jgi:prepilin-type N-terminal cleavage/methylation domain-containing protein
MNNLNANPSVHKQAGFTLLEVIVALAITGFILGGLFSLVGGSKQLSWRSEESLIRATQVRAATNFALLENEYRDIEPILLGDAYDIVSDELLEEPERKTQPSTFALQAFEIFNDDRDEVISGSRWIQLDLPR